MDTVTIIISAVGVLGTIGTFYFGFKSLRLERAKKSFTWEDIERGANYIMKRAEKDFHPDILLMMSGPGAIVTSLAMVQSGRFYPTYVAMLEDQRNQGFGCKPKEHVLIATKKWNVYIPQQICFETDKRLMVIDDCVISGDLQTAVCDWLTDKGFPRDRILFTTLVSSTAAVEANKASDIYWYLNPHGDFYFPWGKWF